MEQKTSLIMLGVVALLANITLVYLFTDRSLTGQTPYQQGLYQETILEYDSFCSSRVKCPEGEAYFADKDELTGNIICICPDGTTRQVSSDIRAPELY